MLTQHYSRQPAAEAARVRAAPRAERLSAMRPYEGMLLSHWKDTATGLRTRCSTEKPGAIGHVHMQCPHQAGP